MSDSTKENPIPFNPDHMTLVALKDTANFARWLFDSVGRTDIETENLLFHIEKYRELFLRTW